MSERCAEYGEDIRGDHFIDYVAVELKEDISCLTGFGNSSRPSCSFLPSPFLFL